MARKRKDDSGVAIAPPPPPVETNDGDEKPKPPKPIEYVNIRTQKQPWGFVVAVGDKYLDKHEDHLKDGYRTVGGILASTEYNVAYLFNTIQAAHVHAHSLGIAAGEYNVYAMHIGDGFESGPHEDDESEDDE